MEKPIISLFRDLTSKDPQEVELWSVYESIRTGRWRNPVERVWTAVAMGDKKAAARAKRRLPYMMPTGRYKGGHRAAQLVEYRPCIVLDYDNLEPEALPELRRRALLLPFVEAVFISASGRGLKVVVITDATQEQHPQAYAQAAAFVDVLLGIKCDPACKDISRGHFVSFDPDMEYRQVTEPFHVSTTMHESPPCTELFGKPEQQPSHGTPDATESYREFADAAEALSPQAAARFVESYLILYPAAEGNRNHRLYSLACTALKRGFPEEVIVRAVISEMAAGDFDGEEIERTVKSAYCRRGVPADENGASKRTFGALSAYSMSENNIPDPDEDGETDGEYLRAHTSTFSAEVYDSIPGFLTDVLKYTDDARERDMLLLSTITVLSAAFYNADGYYKNKKHWACMYAFVIAPPGSSKGIMEVAINLCRYYVESVHDQNEKLEKQYKKDLEAYEKSMRVNRRGKGDQQPQKPEPPTYRYPHIPANTSKARLVDHLRENGSMTGLVDALESDALFNAIRQDYGDFMYIFRNAFHHEKISASLKSDGKPKFIYCPKLALLISGTPMQFALSMPSAGGGDFSRFLFYTHRQFARWQDVSPGGDEELVERHYDQLAMCLHQKILFLQSSHTRIRLSDPQWRKLNATFSRLLDESAFHSHDDFQSCVKRHGLMTLRVCMVFALLEKATLRMDVPVMECTDTHFEAALALVTTCLEHSRLLLTGVEKAEKEIPELENPNKAQLILEHLAQQFTAAQYYEMAAVYHLKKRMAQNLLRKSIGVYINKLARGLYKKKD